MFFMGSSYNEKTIKQPSNKTSLKRKATFADENDAPTTKECIPSQSESTTNTAPPTSPVDEVNTDPLKSKNLFSKLNERLTNLSIKTP